MIFGTCAGNDIHLYKLRLELLRSEYKCYAIGMVLGAMGGCANEYLRAIEVQYSPVSLEFDDDI